MEKIRRPAIGFEAGKTFKLTADIQPGNATDKTVVWSSSDENVATVSDDGTVTIKKEGNVTIKAEAGGKSTSDTFVFYKGEDPGYYFNETENTYYIWNATGLLAWNAYVTTYTSTTTAHICTSAKLMADISLEGKSWTPVGCFGAAEGKLVEYFYAGTFDGGGHIISNLKIDSSDSYSSYLGLFAYIATDGVVKDLTLSNVAISGNSYIGGIAGYNYGTIENCSVSGSVSGNIGVGGIAGQNNGTITACYWSVPEESSATSGIGDDQVSDPTTKVDGTWDDALSGMNEALGIESEYSYKENDDSTTKETMPLIIVKKSSN